MKSLITFTLLLLSMALSAQQGVGPALATAQSTTVLAYRATTGVPTEATSANAEETRNRYSSRRERTLLGDLDLTGLWGGPTYNYSSTGSDWSLVRGGFGGLEFSESLFLGYGGWGSRESFTTNDVPASGISPEYDFRHGGFIIAYAPGLDKLVHPRFTAIVGPGRIDITNEDALGIEQVDRDRMLVGQLMGGAEINLTQWFRLGFEGGYRFASGVDESDRVTASDVSGAIVQIEARFGFSW